MFIFSTLSFNQTTLLYVVIYFTIIIAKKLKQVNKINNTLSIKPTVTHVYSTCCNCSDVLQDPEVTLSQLERTSSVIITIIHYNTLLVITRLGKFMK